MNVPLLTRPLSQDPFDPERGSLVLNILVILFLQDCAERPSSQFDAVTQSLQDAKLAGAGEYAVEELQQAETFYRQAMEELASQDHGVSWLRNYSAATRHLDHAHSQADAAQSEAQENLSETKSNTQTALALARDQIEQTQTLLAQPFSTHGLTRQFEELRHALQKGKVLINAMEVSMGAGDYIQVMISAHVVETLALTIHQRALALLNRPPAVKVQV